MALTKTILCNLALSKIGNELAQLSDFDEDTGKIKDQCNLHYEPTLHEVIRMHTWNCTKERAKLVETVTLITDSNDVEYTYNATENGKAQFSNSADDKRIRYNSTTSKWEYGTYSAPTFTKVDDVSSTNDIPPTTGWDTGITSLTHTYDFGWSNEYIVPSDCIRPVYLTNTTESTRFLRPMIDWTIEVDRIRANQSPTYLLYIKEPTPAQMDPLFARAFYTLLAAKLAMPVRGDKDLAVALQNEFDQVVMPEARRVNSFEGQESPVVDSNWLEATYTSPSNLGSSWPPFSSSSYGTFSWS